MIPDEKITVIRGGYHIIKVIAVENWKIISRKNENIFNDEKSNSLKRHGLKIIFCAICT